VKFTEVNSSALLNKLDKDVKFEISIDI
jgi:hypothetical protein